MIHRAKRELVQMVISADNQVCLLYYDIVRPENRYIIKKRYILHCKKKEKKKRTDYQNLKRFTWFFFVNKTNRKNVKCAADNYCWY